MFKKYKYDIILIIAILVISLTSFLIINNSSNNEKYLFITNCNNEELVIDMNKESDNERELIIDGLYNDVIIKVNKNYAYVSYSSCPHHDCLNKGKISKNKEYIVCLYNKVSLVIKDNTEGYDILL